MRAQIERFWKDDSGATAIEYGLIAALIAVALIAALETLGGTLSNFFNGTASVVSSKTPS